MQKSREQSIREMKEPVSETSAFVVNDHTFCALLSSRLVQDVESSYKEAILKCTYR